MVITELISELKTAGEAFEWKLLGSSRRLRGFVRASATDVPLDPIRALCFLKTGQMFEDRQWLEAGRAIGMAPADCLDIIEASNNELHERSNNGNEMDPYKEWLRRQLTFAVGLPVYIFPADRSRTAVGKPD